MIPVFLATLVAYTLHAKDVFQPPAAPPAATWNASNDEHRTPLEFSSSEGSPVRGWLYNSGRANAPFVLFFYGSNEDIAHEAKRLAWLRDTFQVNAVSFDYPGYGFSGGKVDIPAIRSAALQEFDYVRSQLARGGEPIVVYGWSIGTGLAIEVASERKAAGLILQAPPGDAEGMTRRSSKRDVPWFARGVVKIDADPEVRGLYGGATAIRNARCPLLVIHGTLDDVVPIEQGRAVFQASPAEHKDFVEVPGAHHNDLRVSQPPGPEAIGRFLKRLENLDDTQK